MNVSKMAQEAEKEPLHSKEEQVKALRMYLTAEDQREVVQQFDISIATYNRVIREFDLTHKVLQNLVQRAQANKAAAVQAAENLKTLL